MSPNLAFFLKPYAKPRINIYNNIILFINITAKAKFSKWIRRKKGNKNSNGKTDFFWSVF